MESSRFTSPLRYPGGKACIFPFVSNLIYENKLIGTSYAEPYAGGSGLALRLLFDEYVDKIYINDLDRAIYTFWKCVLQDSIRLCDWIEDVHVSVDNWHYYKDILNRPDEVRDIDLAKATFFLNRTNISGVIKGGIIGGFEQKGKYKIDARFNKPDLIKRIERISRFRSRINVSNLDGLKFISKMDKKAEEVFIYLDPPYVQKGADLYMNFYAKQDHEKLKRSVSKIRKRWMISYDNNEFILNLYGGRQRIIYQLSQSASNRVGDEVLIFDNNISFQKSVSNLKNPHSVL